MFGCACWPNLRPYNTHNLAFRSQQCVFVGYNIRHKGYKGLHLPTARMYISRDVTFDEMVFPFASPLPSPIQPRVVEHAILLFPHDHMNYCTPGLRADLDAGSSMAQKIPDKTTTGSQEDPGDRFEADPVLDPALSADSGT